jgi:hypothetical protein
MAIRASVRAESAPDHRLFPLPPILSFFLYRKFSPFSIVRLIGQIHCFWGKRTSYMAKSKRSRLAMCGNRSGRGVIFPFFEEALHNICYQSASFTK